MADAFEKEQKQPKSTKAAVGIIFLTVFIDLIGFGIIIPLSPYLARKFEATPLQVGMLMAVTWEPTREQPKRPPFYAAPHQ